MIKIFSTSLIILLFQVFGSIVSSAEPIQQREDSCVILETAQASVQDKTQTWSFELTHPGAYTVQLIVNQENARGEHIGEFSLDKDTVSDKLKKAYIIEEGLVSEFSKPALFKDAGTKSITIESNIKIRKVRLVPQGYTKSRIYISSDRYYGDWMKMHNSPAKVAAMDWYKKAKFGMFIHWGVYSKAAGSWNGVPIEEGQGPSVAEWIMFAFEISREEYKEYAKEFKPDKSFAANIAELAKKTGMTYVVLTAKHHDGFALYDSKHSDLDIKDTSDYDGDLVKELYDACRAEGLDFGVYYSHGRDWSEGTDSNYAKVKAYNDQFEVHTRPNGVNTWDPSPHAYEDYLENKAYAQIAELIKLLPDLRLIWFDGDGLITEAQAFRFYKMVYDLNPHIVVSRRVGYNFGDYIDAGDNKTPAANELASKHFETCGTANHSWGFKAQDNEWKSSNELLRKFLDIVSKGGNYLLNIGPDSKGTVPEPCVNSFLEMGAWVKLNADAIYGTTRWKTFNEGVEKNVTVSKPSEFWFSAKEDKVYAMSLAPAGETAEIFSLNKSVGNITNIRLLGSKQNITWLQTEQKLTVDLPVVKNSGNGYVLEVTIK
ncbi:MAG: alpha-L-fucosidase [Akkermansiaceae bacterium]